jgi:hypothetical protein
MLFVVGTQNWSASAYCAEHSEKFLPFLQKKFLNIITVHLHCSSQAGGGNERRKMKKKE